MEIKGEIEEYFNEKEFTNGDTCIQDDLLIYYIYLRVSEGEEIKYPRRVKHCKIDLGI